MSAFLHSVDVSHRNELLEMAADIQDADRVNGWITAPHEAFRIAVHLRSLGWVKAPEDDCR